MGSVNLFHGNRGIHQQKGQVSMLQGIEAVRNFDHRA